MRAVSFDLCRGRESVFTHVKLGRFVIIGFVHEPNLDHWKGSKVHASFGHIQPRKYVVPAALGEYWNTQSLKVHAALASVSDTQQVKVEQSFRAKIDEYAGSDAFAAMRADVEMFGDEAFTPQNRGAQQ